jgi:hypothetical protein
MKESWPARVRLCAQGLSGSLTALTGISSDRESGTKSGSITRKKVGGVKEYFTIGELAELFGLNIQTLYYYDSIGIFSAEKAGAGNMSSTRYTSWQRCPICAAWVIPWKKSRNPEPA